MLPAESGGRPAGVPHRLAVAAVVEMLTGLALLASPALVARLLLGVEPGPGLDAVGRMLGLGLVALGLAAWPIIRAPLPGARLAVLLWQPLAVLGLVTAWMEGGSAGPLLAPALVYHLLAGVLLARRR